MANISFKEAKALEELSAAYSLDDVYCIIDPDFPQLWIDDTLQALGRAILSTCKFKKFEPHPLTE